jgi:F-type H+-transporting ATPase subunit b
MRKAVRTAALLMALAAPVLLAAEERGEGESGRLLLYRSINFVLLAGGLGYLANKYGGPFFAARKETIRREIAEAAKMLLESEERARAIEERLAGLDGKIAELRAAAAKEIAAEQARLEREAEQAVRKVFAQAEREIVASAKAARLELKAYAAALAVGLAEKKIAGRITPEVQRALVSEFTSSLH